MCMCVFVCMWSVSLCFFVGFSLCLVEKVNFFRVWLRVCVCVFNSVCVRLCLW